MIISYKLDIMREYGEKEKLLEHPNLMLDLLEVDKNENEQHPSSSHYSRRNGNTHNISEEEF